MTNRVLVVDDSAVFRRVMAEALRDVPGIEVVGTANDGAMVLPRIASLRPDLITLDIEMPRLNGLQVLEAMHAAKEMPGVIVASALTSRGGQMTVRALELGAFDFIAKPEAGTPEQNILRVRDALVPIIRAFNRRREIRTILNVPQITRTSAPETSFRAPRRSGTPIVLLGVSTGGPAALAKLLPALPTHLGAPILVVQHMPPHFTGPLAASLAKKCSLPVKEAVDGEVAFVDHVYLAPGGQQMKILPGPKGEILVRTSDDPAENNCKPAVDYLFRSAALHFPGRSIAVILTGMGADGTAGLRLLKRSGCVSIAQDEASCVVFGMPKEAIAAGLVDTVAPLDSIAGAIVRSVQESRL